MAAAQAAQAGLSLPPDWYYPVWTAHLWALIPPEVLIGVLRLGNLLGGAWAAALVAGVMVGRKGALCPLLAVTIMLGATPFLHSLVVGNVTGLLLLAVLVAMRCPAALRDGVLAVTCLLKPIALGPALALRGRTVFVVGVATVAAHLVTPTGGLGRRLYVCTNAAPQRALHDLGIPLPWQAVTLAALVGAYLSSRGSWERGLAWGWLALPMAWPHTSLLLVPAWSRAWTEASPFHRLWLCAAGVVLCMPSYWGLPSGGVFGGLLGLVPAAAVMVILRPVRHPGGCPVGCRDITAGSVIWIRGNATSSGGKITYTNIGIGLVPGGGSAPPLLSWDYSP